MPRADLGGARLVLLAQARLAGPPPTVANFVLTGQPFAVTPDWSEQTIELVPDPDQWTCLGARHDLADLYGYGHIADALRDVNVDLIFVLFPLHVVPVGPVDDLHRRWAARDYRVDMQYLPKGLQYLRPFASVEVRTTGFLAAFGRREGQRRLLAAADAVLDPVVPARWRYIGCAVAVR